MLQSENRSCHRTEKPQQLVLPHSHYHLVLQSSGPALSHRQGALSGTQCCRCLLAAFQHKPFTQQLWSFLWLVCLSVWACCQQHVHRWARASLSPGLCHHFEIAALPGLACTHLQTGTIGKCISRTKTCSSWGLRQLCEKLSSFQSHSLPWIWVQEQEHCQENYVCIQIC